MLPLPGLLWKWNIVLKVAHLEVKLKIYNVVLYWMVWSKGVVGDHWV